jgi:hypothetical protein
MRAETLIQLYYKVAEAMVFQERQKVHFLVFSIFGLVCYFASYCGMALVS